ncbi:MAG: hypothetical protein M3O35_19030 [Acidobacteriota bacterium]|nr:hypothetical protein [Acidobacteriota bacterium]
METAEPVAEPVSEPAQEPTALAASPEITESVAESLLPSEPVAENVPEPPAVAATTRTAEPVSEPVSEPPVLAAPETAESTDAVAEPAATVAPAEPALEPTHALAAAASAEIPTAVAELAPPLEALAAFAGVTEMVAHAFPPSHAHPVEDLLAPARNGKSVDPAHCGALGSAIATIAENILETIPTEPVLRIAESFQTAPLVPLLPAGEPFAEPSASQKVVVTRPNITVRAIQRPPLVGKPESLAFGQNGPLLPAELSRVARSAPPPVQPPELPKRRSIPGWLLTPIVVVLAFIAAHFWLQSSGAAGEAKPVAAAPPVVTPLSPGGASAMATSPEGWPFAHYIEVTALRVVADLNHHSRLHYIVVNHSAADLSDVALKIGVRSANDTSKTLFRVSAVVPSLGPFASKEITVDLDSQIRASEIPEWELLRADVQAGPR